MDNLVISVIIPTYNRGDTLRHAVASVLNQSYKNFEVIVVDDCSAKSAAESLKEAGISDPRVRVVRHDVNQGQAAARNTGAREARGQWLAFLDDDDTFYRPKLLRQLGFMKRNNLRVSVTDFTLPGDHHRYNFRNSDADPTWLLLTGRFLALPSTMMIEKKLYQEMGGFDQDPRVRRTEDYDFALRLYKHEQPLTVMRMFGSHYSGFHPASAEFELKALMGVEEKHRHIFQRGTRVGDFFHAGMEWKKTHAQISGKPFMEAAFKLGALAFQYPAHFIELVSSVVENPLRRMFPPSGRPRLNLPSDKKLIYPYIPV